MRLIVDLGLLFVLFLSVIGGMRRGFLEAFISLIAFIAGILAAFHLPRQIIPHLPAWAQTALWVEVLLTILVFLMTVLLIRLIGTLSGAGTSHQIDPASRMAGGLLGAVRGALLCGFLASILVLLIPPDREVLQRSLGLRILEPVGRWVALIAPGTLSERLDDAWKDLHDVRDDDAIESISVDLDSDLR